MSDVTTRYPQGTPCWVDLAAADQQAALAFYRDLFGWEGEVGPAEFGGYAVCTVRGQPVAGIMGATAPEGQPAPTGWTTHLAADDLDAVAAAIADTGGTVRYPPMDVGTLGRMLIADDPAGAPFGAWQPLDFIGAQAVNEPGALTWNELLTPEPELARAFYADVFTVRTSPMAGAAHYWTLDVAGRPVGGIAVLGERMPAGTPPHWLAHFAVDDTDSTVDALVRAGGTILQPPVDTPYGRAAVLRDPQGAGFGVIAIPG